MNILRYIVEHAPREIEALERQKTQVPPQAVPPLDAQRDVWIAMAKTAEQVVGPVPAVTGPQFQRINALRVIGEQGEAILQRYAQGRGLDFSHPQPDVYIEAVRDVVARVRTVVPRLGELGHASAPAKNALRR